MSTSIHRNPHRTAGVFDLHLLRQLTTVEMGTLADLCDKWQDHFDSRPEQTLICNWLACQARNNVCQRLSEQREERSWELPRNYMTQPATVATALFELYLLSTSQILTPTQRTLVDEILGDLVCFSYHYLKHIDGL